MTINLTSLTPLSVAALVVAGGLAFAADQYGPGASDTEIKIGKTMPVVLTSPIRRLGHAMLTQPKVLEGRGAGA